jgi:hypothetical protein
LSVIPSAASAVSKSLNWKAVVSILLLFGVGLRRRISADFSSGYSWPAVQLASSVALEEASHLCTEEKPWGSRVSNPLACLLVAVIVIASSL